MGIDFTIDHDCEPKRALGSDALVELLKARDRARMVLETMRAEGDERPVEELTFVSAVLRRDGAMEEREVTVGAMLEAAAPLEAHAHHCTGCPANVTGEPYGCNGYIGYPIEAESESWLLDRLPDDLSTTAGWLLQQAFADFGWDGAYAARLRGDGPAFFEADRAPGIRWGDAPDAFAITGNQLFDCLFGLGPLQPAHLAMMALFLGVVPHDLPPEAVGTALRGGEEMQAVLDLGSLEVDGASEQIRALALLLRAVARAAVLGEGLRIDG